MFKKPIHLNCLLTLFIMKNTSDKSLNSFEDILSSLKNIINENIL